MPRFYFDICEGPRFVPDREGLDLDSLDAAEREAVTAAAAIGAEQMPKGRVVSVAVRDELGQRMLAVAVSMHISRATSPSALGDPSSFPETDLAGFAASTRLLE